MASRKRQVEIEVVADTKKATAALQGIDTKISKTGQAFSTAGKVMAGALSAGVVLDFAQDSIRAFSDLEQSVGGTEAVFGDASEVIDRFAGDSAKSMGLAESEFRTATTLMGGSLKRMTGDVDFAAEKSVELVGVAADLAATYGGTTKEAVEALGAAFRGEADPAERFNLDLKVGKVNAKAVEMGLADTTTAVDDYAKAQALLALIMEQSADAQGQFRREAESVAGKAQIAAAQLENMKARAGEAILPFEQLKQEIQLTAAQGLGVLATQFRQLVGAVDPASSHIQQFAVYVGDAAAATAAGALTIVQQYGGAFEELLPKLALSRDELIKLRDADDELLKSFGFTQAQIEELRDAVGIDLARSLTDNEQHLRTNATWLQNAADKADELAGSSGDAGDQVKYLGDQLLAAADPAFNLLKKHEAFVTAQQKYNDAVAEFGPESAQARSATADLLESAGGLNAAQEKFSREHGPAGEQALRDLAREAGIYDSNLGSIFDHINRINGQKVVGPSFKPLPAGGRAFHSGGVVPGSPGEEVPAVLMAGETVLPTHRGGGGGGGGTIVIPIYLAGKKIDEVVVPAIERYNRRNGRTF